MPAAFWYKRRWYSCRLKLPKVQECDARNDATADESWAHNKYIIGKLSLAYVAKYLLVMRVEYF